MANRIKGITVEIGGDNTELDKALKNVNSSITKTQSALNDVNRLLETDLTNLTQQAITLDELYGIDMNETLRGVNSLMQQYSLTAQEAMG